MIRKPTLPFLTITLFLLVALAFPYFAFCEQPQNYDQVCLKSGTIIDGCILLENSLLITIESLGGSVSVPVQTVEKVEHARPGESELMLGIHLLEQKKLDRAERVLKKASVYAEWREASKEAMERLEQYKQELLDKQKQNEQQEIENLIRRKGLQAGINALERRHKPEENEDSEYWGDMRGRLHLMMARDCIDHLDLREAERQLTLAEKYGVDSKQWEAVRKELLETRKESVLLGPSALASRRFSGKDSKNKSDKASTFLAAVQDAQKRGESLPPIQMLRAVDEHAKANGVDPLLVWAIIDTESAWQENAVSPKGALGLMQLMPPTAKDLDVENPFNAEDNIRGGISYMRFLMEMFNDDLDTVLAAYNVGPGRVERTGIPPAGKRYAEKVRKRFSSLQQRFKSARVSS